MLSFPLWHIIGSINAINWYLADLPNCQKYYKNENSACLQGKKVEGTTELQILMVAEQMEKAKCFQVA